MRRKNGFIATTLIYSFLLLFATLVIVIIGNYTYYRSTINAYNKGINNALNNLIDTKYVTLTNLVNNSDFEINGDSWVFSDGRTKVTKNTNPSYNSEEIMGTGSWALKFKEKSNATVRSNYFDCVANHYYYISYQTFTNGTVGPVDTGTSNGSGSNSSGVGSIISGILGGLIGWLQCIITGTCTSNNSLENYEVNTYNNDIAIYASGSQTGTMGLFDGNTIIAGESINFGFLNKQRKGYIGLASKNSSTCNFAINYNNNNNTKMFIDNVVVTDVTDIMSNGRIDSSKYVKVTEIFNTTATSGNIPYFHDTYTYNMDNLKNNLN